MPQLLLTAVFIAKTGQFDAIIVISFISSLWSLTSRVSADDTQLFMDEWKLMYEHGHLKDLPTNLE